MEKLLEALKPKPCPFELVRIGGDRDGAYLLPADFYGIKACFSPGVANRKNFEDQLLDDYQIESHMCDFSSDEEKFRTPLRRGQTFKKKWLDIDEVEDSITLKDWVEELAPNKSDDLILQMDIEGAEFRNLLNTPDETLRRFRIIVIELHGLGVLKSSSRVKLELGPLLDRLDEHFLCVHAHPNNCCGEFTLTDSGLNIPNVLELTFLRRDRWSGFTATDCHDPMLPHPLDISPNVPGKPPICLNQHWLESKERHPASEIKRLSELVGYLERALENSTGSHASAMQEMVLKLHKLAQYCASLLPEPSLIDSRKDLVDLAGSRSFILSSRHSACPGLQHVKPRSPFFFHTAEGYNQSIIVDLGICAELWELRICNRLDVCKDRARCLFYCIHDTVEPDFVRSFPVAIEEGFFTAANQVSVTNLRGTRGRFVTVFSPERTMLHFSDLQVMGCS